MFVVNCVNRLTDEREGEEQEGEYYCFWDLFREYYACISENNVFLFVYTLTGQCYPLPTWKQVGPGLPGGISA